ncbi:translation factor [Thermococcus indicus]|uniref:Translation factor n=1 Tax=Thermococcus indicus TaxID=2586643 RepID=A0A4Y5SQ50_9EURY|nr:tRNA-binding protein Pbp11 [Thermococcus indicus]QDA32272.1 translation factor [Thermococcus indicus]
MNFLRIFRRKREETPEVEIVSRRPVGRFKVEKILRVLKRQVLIGEVLEGLIYPGYKVKGRKAGLIMEIERNHQKVNFAVAGDRVALMLENEIPCEKGETLEVYQS